MFVCVRLCVCVCVCVCRVCVGGFPSARECVQANVRTCVCARLRACVRVCAPACVRAFVRVLHVLVSVYFSMCSKMFMGVFVCQF